MLLPSLEVLLMATTNCSAYTTLLMELVSQRETLKLRTLEVSVTYGEVSVDFVKQIIEKSPDLRLVRLSGYNPKDYEGMKDHPRLKFLKI